RCSRCHDSDVLAVTQLAAFCRSGEERLVWIYARGWEQPGSSVEHSFDLGICTTDRRRRGHELGARQLARLIRSACRYVDRGLEKADRRPKRAGNQVQLILDDEVRSDISRFGVAEECADRSVPRHSSKLVYRADYEFRSDSVDVLVDDVSGDAAARMVVAFDIGAVDSDRVRTFGDTVGGHVQSSAAPGACLELHRIALLNSVAISEF